MTPAPLRPEALLPCPFCGDTPDINNVATFTETNGSKWGAVSCCCYGPEVRTGYRPLAEWRDAAIAAWNRRAPAPTVESLRALLGRVVEWDSAQELEQMERDPFHEIVADIKRALGGTP